MSAAAITYSFVTATTIDPAQVNQNFADLLSFINGSVPHSDGTGGDADLRGLTFLKTADNGKKIAMGGPTNVAATNGQNETDTTISFGGTFDAAPDVIISLGTVHPSNPVNIRVKSVTTSNFVVAMEKSDGSQFNSNATYNVFWFAIG